MEDRFLFRGIDSYSKKWVQGDLSTMGSVPLIFSGIDVDHVVVPITIGQCTGLKDINGTFIFGGDIVKWGHLMGSLENPHRIAIVKINPDIQFYCASKNHTFHYGSFSYQQTDKALEIIGNIHENPELLTD